MYFLFFLLVTLLPTQMAIHFWPDWALAQGIRVDYLAPTIYLTDILVVFILVLNLKDIATKVRQKIKSINYILAICLIVFLVANVSYSTIWQVTLVKWVKVFELGFLGLYVYQDKKGLFDRIQKPLLIAVSYSLLIAIIQIIKGGTLGGPLYFLGERSFNVMTPGIALVNIFGRNFLRPYATFSHPNVFAGFMLVSFLIFLLKKNKIGITLSLLGVAVSCSLGAYIALFCVLIFKKWHRFLFHILLYFSLVLPIFSSFLLSSGMLFPKTIEERFALSKTAGMMFSKSPLVGTGFGSSIVADRMFQPTHNIFLLLLAEVGVVGVSLFSYLIIKLLRNKRESTADNWRIIIFAILLTGIFDHYWLTLQQAQLLFAIVIGGII